MGVSLEWHNDQTDHAIEDELIAQLTLLLGLAAEQEHVSEGEVVVSFVSDEHIRQLNRTYRGIDQPTDVLSFAMQEEAEDELDIVYGEADAIADTVMLGDIVISVPRAIAQSEDYGHSFEREIGFLFVHGFLHLIGYDHQDTEAEEEMFAKQEHILQKAGLTR